MILFDFSEPQIILFLPLSLLRLQKRNKQFLEKRLSDGHVIARTEIRNYLQKRHKAKAIVSLI